MIGDNDIKIKVMMRAIIIISVVLNAFINVWILII